jgi:5'-3' exonuclease
MGIKKFKQWFLFKFHHVVDTVEETEPESYDHVYFDLNQNFHKAARRADSEEKLITIAIAELEKDLKTFTPKKSIHFILDGY